MQLVDFIVEYLKQAEITHAFGMSGANIEILFHRMHHHNDVTAVLAKHESAAVNMAAGYYHKTGKPGVVMSTSGGGAFNLLSPMIESLSSAVPMIAIVGQIPTSLEGIGGFQDSSGIGTPIDSMRIFDPVSVYLNKIEMPEDICQVLKEAFDCAINKRGPAVILIPRDLQETEIGEVDVKDFLPDPGKPSVKIAGSLKKRVNELLQSETQPVIIAGKEVLIDGAIDELADFAQHIGAKVTLTPDSKGAFDHLDPRFAGIAGVMGHENGLRHIRNSECCFLIGTRLPLMSRFGVIDELRGKTVINMNRSQSFLNNKKGSELWKDIETVDLIGPVKDLLLQLKDVIPPPGDHSFTEDESLEFITLPASEHKTLDYKSIVDLFSSYIAERDDVYADAGNTGASLVHYLPFRAKGIFSVALGMGGMGYTFGAAIGSSIASQNRTWVFAGDGSFFMHGLEIHTAVEYDLPITFVVFDNSSHAMCHIREDVFLGGKTNSQVFKPSRIAHGINAMFPQIRGYEVFDLYDLEMALENLKGFHGTSIISVHISPDVLPPFIPFLN